MNILKWLKSKSGKLPVTLAQAAGITAVVGAAGFGAMTFLSSPADNNNTFLPPSVTQGEVVYISQSGGGGQYEANGEVGSAFNAAPSRAIQLANQQAARQAQTRALEESSQQVPSYNGESSQMPQAYQLSGADLGQGLGGGKNKDLNASLDTFSTLQNQLSGVTQAITNAQAQAAGSQTPGTPAATSGQTAAQLAGASRNWGNGGLTRAGGGSSGSSNAFVIQNSGKNKPGGAAEQASMAQAGNAIAQAQAAMAQLQQEGTRLPSRANFGRSEGFKEDKDARTMAARRFGNAKAELDFIRKKSAAIASNKTNAANEGGSPFLASTKISGGLTVDGEQVTTGQSSTSSDFNGKFDRAMKGIGAKLGLEGDALNQRSKDRHKLREWMYIVLPLALTMIPIIGTIMSVSRICLASINPIRHAIGIALKILGYV
ncbi:MAG: hypothetical protein J6Q05_05655, partial [Elusimicrobiaceae bacterium]|nr:hypothetical protein [Elusimicrobiaceae bacterium]